MWGVLTAVLLGAVLPLGREARPEYTWTSEHAPEDTCGYNSCPETHAAMINVHLVPHTHDDVGWLKTVDQYYYGDKSSIQMAGVQYILDSVIPQLLKDPSKRFIYVEIAFFARWWREQNNTTRDSVRMLVNQGRLEFILGGWCMNDEATTHYNAIIDQHTLGFEFLKQNFGECGRPRVAWQIDPFGHSREQASLFAQMGFDGLFFGRLDHADKDLRLNQTNMEFVWRGSPNNLGKSARLFTGVLYNGYGPPAGFCWDIGCGDDPFMDDDRLHDTNVNKKVADFIKAARDQAKHYYTNSIMMTMGSDFNYQNANMWFKNMDKLIKYVNAQQSNGSNVHVMYSTPSCYLLGRNRLFQAWNSKADDFFPYSEHAHSYWTGYFTSRPALKEYIRRTNNFLQVCKQVAAAEFIRAPEVEKLKEAMAVVQHHDAVSGTEKQHVANDYAQRLAMGISGCQMVLNYGFSNMLTVGSSLGPPEQNFCPLLNISKCTITENGSPIVVLAYNPLGREILTYFRIPVVGTAYTVTDKDGTPIPVQFIPVSNATKAIPERAGTRTDHDLVFTENIQKNNKSLNAKMDKIDINVKKIHSEVSKIQKEVSKVQTEITTLKLQVSGMKSDIDRVKSKNTDIEKSMETISDLYDDMKKNTEQKFKELNDVKNEILEQTQNRGTLVKELESDKLELKKETEQLQYQIEDLQWRSMKQNLIFTGLFEERYEDTEAKLRQFLAEQLGVDWFIEFGNVHRFQKHVPGKTRPIVARFLYNRDRQAVKDRAYYLRNTRFGISDQLPASMDARRKELLPVLREQRALGNRAKLVRDKLIVNGRLYVPGDTAPPDPAPQEPPTTRPQRPQRPPRQDRVFDNRLYNEVAGRQVGEKRRRPSSETSVKGPPSTRQRYVSPEHEQSRPKQGANVSFGSFHREVEHPEKPQRVQESNPEVSAKASHIDSPKASPKVSPKADIILKNEHLSLTFDGTTGRLRQMQQLEDSLSIALNQDYMYYIGYKGNNSKDEFQNSGAYIFRPNGSVATNFSQASLKTKEYITFGNAMVREVHQQFSPWVSQVVRLYEKEKYAEFEWTIGPIPINDGYGKEVISRFTTNLNSFDTFYTDANGREILQRRYNHRDTWPLNQTEAVAGNYYPVNSRIFIRDESRNIQLTVLTDRSQGGSSLRPGSIELMVHRRLLGDDSRGVAEPLNETGVDGRGLVIRGKHYVFLDTIAKSARRHRDIAVRLFMAPSLSFMIGNGPREVWIQNWGVQFTSIKTPLPANVHLLTLETWTTPGVEPFEDRAYLLRLEHIYEVDEDAELSQPVTLDLNQIFKFSLQITNEVTLGANLPLSQLKRMEWTVIDNDDAAAGPETTLHVENSTTIITLTPMQIRTFIVKRGPE